MGDASACILSAWTTQVFPISECLYNPSKAWWPAKTDSSLLPTDASAIQPVARMLLDSRLQLSGQSAIAAIAFETLSRETEPP